ncbi:hypothetical protein COT75_04195 [Candidatus Beckwithbacteria bacterium CG10_big_fil_rev_8_21_14_0_10_34_10]|uniref:Uncharacterized protein n=1 Tax=Candidatus Beckwithbacteria bacterium CG10_big_fil_rev_8_21_14_0_10_34_10 TaxID=1974495 RepID=A0A2H0W8D6_9BACT|nr:MAG: hypothetical protein COT75_04195 [Candidatus Beckwithbacteria bacterium CG10_big_fil_rev_8_21_14_0_10_34_10]
MVAEVLVEPKITALAEKIQKRFEERDFVSFDEMITLMKELGFGQTPRQGLFLDGGLIALETAFPEVEQVREEANLTGWNLSASDPSF